MPQYVKPLSRADRRAITGAPTPGVLVLFDIVNSTSRKLADADWWRQTAVVYRAFVRLEADLARFLRCKAPGRKFIGDGLMLFVPLHDDTDGELDERSAIGVLRRVKAFREQVAAAPPALLGGLQLKTVVSLLRGPRNVGGEFLNRGVDFTFRMEQFGGPDHFVRNEAFFEAITADGAKRLGFSTKAAVGRMKGWAWPQGFHELRSMKAPRR